MYAPDYFNPYAKFAAAQKEVYSEIPAVPSKRTTDPVNTGTSVLGIKYKDGVMLAADTCVSYGSLARYRNIQRMSNIGDFTLLGATGEYSDFQFMLESLDQLVVQDLCYGDGHTLSPKEIHRYLTRVMYNKRSRFDPWYNQLVLAGFKNEQKFLGYIDLVGTSYEDNTLATGYGAYIAQPLLRKAWREDLTQEQAKKILEDAMRVLFYRDARSLNRIQLAKVDASGWVISEPYLLETEWENAEKVMSKEF